MKKLKLLIFLLITILILPGKAYAAFPDAYPLGLSQEYIWQRTGYGLDGFPDETGTIYTYDYREFPMHPKRTLEEKPTAQFAVHVNGQEKAKSDAGYDLDAFTTVLDVNIDDKIEIVDHSKPYGNYTLNKWDFQYRIVPVDNSVTLSDIDDYRKNFLIKSSTFDSKTGPNNYFQDIWKEARELYPDRNFYIELYMQVYDINYKDGSYAGGENGTYGCIREKDDIVPSEYEKGNTWYFTTVLLRVNTQGTPDFYPTPEGSTEWKPQYKDPKYCAKTYVGNPGQIIDIPVSLHNAGEIETTDFAATWFGSTSGSDPRSYGWVRPLWKEDNITLDKGEKRDLTIPVKIPDIGQETRLVFLANVDGKTPASEINQENNMMIIKITSEINLVAVDIKSGASVPVLDKKYTGTVTFKNDSAMALSGVPIAVYNNGYRATLNDSAGNVVTQADFLPGETKQFTFTWTLCRFSKLEGIINISPLPTVYPETNYKDNKVTTVISAPINGAGGQELNFQARRQWSFIDVMGGPKEYRKPNTARYTDIVETTLTPTNIKKVKYTVSKGDYVDYKTTIAPPVPTCGDSCGAWNTMTDWKVVKATLHYPDKSDGFTFGHPFWNNDWTYKSMKPQGKTAFEQFREAWAMDGAPVFDRVINDFVGPPKHYELWAEYTIQVTYDQTCGYEVCETDDEGNTTCWCEYDTTRGKTATFNYTGTGKLLVDGTGAAPVPAENVIEFKEAYPHLVEVPY